MTRSFLFVPGNMPKRFANAFASGADAVIQDLEDAVAVAEKATAREAIAASLSDDASVRRYVRVNALDTPHCWGDLDAVVRPGLDGVVVPKAESGDQMKTLDWVLSQHERERGLENGAIEILPLVESGRGLADLDAIGTASRRIRRLSYGALDLGEDLDLQPDADEAHLATVRWQLTVASRAAGLETPVDTVFADIADSDGFAASARRARAKGHGGKLCIHPSQVEAVNAAFAPTAAEIEKARTILATVEAAGGDVGAVQVGGAMVDRPVILRARRTMAAAGETGGGQGA